MTMSRNSRIVRVIPLLITICLLSSPAYAKYGGGTGEPNDPYLIDTVEQMNEIGLHQEDWGKHFRLMEDIDMSNFTGTDFNIIRDFTGVFDGNGHTISNFTYTSIYRDDHMGLFGSVSGENAEIKDLGLIDPNVDAGTGDYVGALVGFLLDGSITHCYVKDGSVAGSNYVGGLVGECSVSSEFPVPPRRRYRYSAGSVTGKTDVSGLVGDKRGGTIENCYTTGSVQGKYTIGGLVGSNYGIIINCSSSSNVSGEAWVGGLVGEGGVITNCYSSGNITGNSNVGGLVGANSTISNCYSSGDVSGGTMVGGLVGYNGWDAITNSYSVANVAGTVKVGGLVGENDDDGKIINCYSLGRISGTTNVGGLIGIGGDAYSSYWNTQTSNQSTSDGGTDKTTAEMQMASTFLGWGCDPVWTINEGADYPRLWWENMPGETITTPSPFESEAGRGTESEPYLIYTADELNMIGQFPYDWGKHFKLMADIDLKAYKGTDFNIIGLYSWPFSGVFDGNRHTISNFTYDCNGVSPVGLFAYIDDPNAEIKDLGLIDPNVEAGTGYHAGSLVGHLSSGIITNCYVQSGSVSGDSGVGGLVGGNDSGTISNCYATTSVSGDEIVGGLVGLNDSCVWGDGTITNCYSVGSVAGNDEVGGLVGENGGIITNCYSTGSVSGDLFVGGLVGINDYGAITNSYAKGNVLGYGFEGVGGLVGTNCGTITNCYSVANVTGIDKVGGLVGSNGGVITNCYATGEVSGDFRLGGLVGLNYSLHAFYREGTVMSSFWNIQTSGQTSGVGPGPGSDGISGKTTAEMKAQSTFTDAGWDFVDETENGTEDIWKITEGLSYPLLSWEKYGGGTGEHNHPYRIYTAEHLNTIGLNEEDADKHFKLMADIDLSAYQGDSFNRIGFYDAPEFAPDLHPPFEGVFDGNGHTISNFTYVVDVNEPMKENGLWGDECVGLFGVVSGAQTQIKNLGLINPNIYPTVTCTERVTSVGAIAGELNQASITNCYVEGGRISGDNTVGGLVGSNSDGTISNCYTTCDVTWAKGRWLRPLDLPFDLNPGSFGGLVGSSRGWIYNCHATGSIQGAWSTGGLVGSNSSDLFRPDLEIGVISNSYATGDVTGDEDVGGLAGNNSGKILQSIATGNVSGLDKVGGLVGNMIMDEGSINYSYSIANVSGNEQVGGLVGYSNGSIQQSFAESEVSGTVYVGGLVGFNGSGTIHHSYSWGSVTGSENVGGLSGRNGKGNIYCCYAANTVNTAPGSEYVGGLLGSNISGMVSACFWNTETSGLLDMCGLHSSDYDGCDNEYGKTTIEMQTASTFLDVGWDFVDETMNGTEDIWWILEGQDYPRLWWEASDL